jgi:nitrate reductase gamma subunit
MDISREIFWNVGQGARWITYALMVVTFIILIYGFKKRYAMWRIGQSTPFRFTDRLCERIAYFIKSAVLHRSILKMGERYPGYMHLLIFWGFLVLAIGTALVALEDDVLQPLFKVGFLHGNFYLIFSFLLDAAGLAAMVGVAMAFVRRYVLKPERLDNKPEDLLTLIWIFVVLLTGFLAEAARIAFSMPEFERVSFVGYFLSSLFLNLTKDGVKAFHAGF